MRTFTRIGADGYGEVVIAADAFPEGHEQAALDERSGTMYVRAYVDGAWTEWSADAFKAGFIMSDVLKRASAPREDTSEGR